MSESPIISESVDDDGETGFSLKPLATPWLLAKMDVEDINGMANKRRVLACRRKIEDAKTRDRQARAVIGLPPSDVIDVLRRVFDERSLDNAMRVGGVDALFNEIDRQLGLPKEER